MKGVARLLALRFPISRARARWMLRYRIPYAFVHINKTGGSSIEMALGIPFAHMTAIELRDLLGASRWNRRYSFAFVRNPWDKVVSHYHYRVKTNQTGLGRDPVPFEEWVIRAYGEHDPALYDQPKMFQPQHLWLDDEQGRQIVDFVGRFERLHEDFAEVCRMVSMQASLPHLKKSKHRDFRELYSPETRDVIGDVFSGDIDRFGYGFE
jgi:hypothetical protein